jgi:hypothetical protein
MLSFKECKMKVRNLQEESHPPTCSCENWLQHWENNSGEKKNTCSALNCSKNAEVGGHVQKRNVGDDRWYIIPICKSCNGKYGQEYEVETHTTFISIDLTSQCGQQLVNEELSKDRRFK